MDLSPIFHFAWILREPVLKSYLIQVLPMMRGWTLLIFRPKRSRSHKSRSRSHKWAETSITLCREQTVAFILIKRLCYPWEVKCDAIRKCGTLGSVLPLLKIWKVHVSGIEPSLAILVSTSVVENLNVKTEMPIKTRLEQKGWCK